MTEGGISPVPRDARPFQGQRAGIVTRLAAAVLDALVVAIVLALGYAGYAGLLFLVDPRSFSFPNPSPVFSLAAAFVVLVIYLSAAWMISGRSYGCSVMGLRVVNFRGEKLRPVGALIRALLCGVLPIGLFWCAVSRENRSLADIVLRTSVIYDWQTRTPTEGHH